jgi:DNA-binding NtrC family response regulator
LLARPLFSPQPPRLSQVFQEARMSYTPKLLILCSDPEGRSAMERALARSPLEKVFAASVVEAREVAEREPVALVFCALDAPDGGFRSLRDATNLWRARVPVVVASRSGDTAEYLDAMRAGAFDFITQPYRSEEVERIVRTALQPPQAA